MHKITPVLIIAVVIVLLTFLPHQSYAQQRFIVKVSQQIFVPGDSLILYGKGIPNDALFVKITDPAGRTIKIDTIRTNEEGSFTVQLFQWPQPSVQFVFGTYAIEVNSSTVLSDRTTLQVTFAEESRSVQPLQHILSVKLDSPTEISANKSFRIFVQVTFDGALVNADPAELLASSHIHSGNTTINLSGKFSKLHEGIYYADVQLAEEGSYIIHSIAFYRGFLAHDSRVVSSGSSLGEVQESINSLKQELDSTSHELKDTRQAVDDAREAIKKDIERAESTVSELQQASGQINSIILPILVLISIIIALQLSLFARIRASFK